METKTIDLTKYKYVSLGLFKFWYEKREDGLLSLRAFRVFNDRWTFYVVPGTIGIISAEEVGDTLRLVLDK